jgi:CPA2 family monovalent cation:H+ antiporter-2
VDTSQTFTLEPKPDVACTHTDRIRAQRPRTPGCEECLALGERWVHLRLCMSCGHVGCCDSSPNKHATAHWHATEHPIMRSIEPGETWGWCFPDTVEL